MDFIKKLFETDFMPHGHCYLWRPEIVWTNAISDSIIAIAYFTIPLSLVHIVRTRKDFKYYWLIVLFAVFILGCGATHIMDVVNIWSPMYRLDSSLRVMTALASIGTAIMLIKITPQILLIPDSSAISDLNEKLKYANKELENSYKEIALREEQLKMMNLELEEKIEARTKELKESEERFRTMADNISNLAWIADAEGYIYWYNKRWYDYTGTTHKEMEGWGWQSVQHPDELPKVMDKWTESIRTGKPFEMIFPLKGADGVFRLFLTRVMPVKNEEGKISQWFGTNTDITAQIEHEEALQNKNKELLKINNDLDNFVYTASHDLKAPISNLEGLMNALPYTVTEETQSNEDFSEMVKMIEASILKFKKTIQDLTQISRVQRNVEEDVEEIQLAEVLEDVKALLKEEITNSNTLIKSNIKELPTIKFSRKNIFSIVYNLMSNAIKYKSPDRQLVLEVTTKLIDNCAVLIVKDNGLGIPLDKKDKIFGMFKRYHTHVEGTGIGLYIVKRIVDNVDGKIEVESEEDKGATFKIYLKA